MPRHYPVELRRQICERLLEGEPVKKLRAEFGISEYTLYRWRRQARVDAGLLPGGKSFEADPLLQARRRIKELEAELTTSNKRSPTSRDAFSGLELTNWLRAVGAGENLHVVPRGILEIEAPAVAVNDALLAVARIGPVPQSPLLHPSEDGVELLLADEKRIVAGLEGCPVVIVQADPVGRLDAHEMTEGFGGSETEEIG
jgi:transposase-like protein